MFIDRLRIVSLFLLVFMDFDILPLVKFQSISNGNNDGVSSLSSFTTESCCILDSRKKLQMSMSHLNFWITSSLRKSCILRERASMWPKCKKPFKKKKKKKERNRGRMKTFTHLSRERHKVKKTGLSCSFLWTRLSCLCLTLHDSVLKPYINSFVIQFAFSFSISFFLLLFFAKESILGLYITHFPMCKGWGCENDD